MLELVEILKKRKLTMDLKMGNYELDLLLFLGFDCNFQLPYEYLYLYSAKFNLEKSDNKIIKIILNESFRRPLCIFFHPKTICLAAIYLNENFLFEKNLIDLDVNNSSSNFRFKTLNNFKAIDKENNLMENPSKENMEYKNIGIKKTKEYFLLNENSLIIEEFDACYNLLKDIVLNSKIKIIK